MTVKYSDYITLRRLGLRAIVAFGIAKYGFDFLVDYLIDEAFERTK